ncbi:MAG: YceI family protein [Corynebacterium glucuronolyticum]|nr:YceI family protein [Corynebacterium glucuronolyticum]MDD7587732.1 YceI family protein [Mycobacteriaceae bacterium]MDY5835051.1 YceI family protein [Corynebacterium glucuronolyticum]
MSHLNGSYTIDPVHSTVGFTVRHAMVTKVHGAFNDFESTFSVNDSAVEGSASIKAASVDTANEQRDEHVKSADFFDVENHPELTFTITSAEVGDGSEGTVTGDLTIKGVTKPVTLDVEVLGVQEDQNGDNRLGFEASTKINRKDFGIDFQAPLNGGGMLVGEKIDIVIEGSAIKNS